MSAAAAVVIPAHNEAAVIDRTLRHLDSAARSGLIEVVVVCNACSDDTASISRRHEGIAVIETDIPSKTNAMNLGDAAVSAWPRLYLDADIEVPVAAIVATAEALERPGVMSARPTSVIDTSRSSFVVRAYYRARRRLTSVNSAMWGAGVYGLSRDAHERMGPFPNVIGDDLWVDRLFSPSEKMVVDTAPAVVAAPRSVSALLAITRRNTSGAQEGSPSADGGPTTRSTVSELARTMRSPRTIFDGGVYFVIAAIARVKTRRRPTRWERDDSSRQ